MSGLYAGIHTCMHIFMHAYKRAYRVPMLTPGVGGTSLLRPGMVRISDSIEKFPGSLIKMQNLGVLVSDQYSRTPNVRDVISLPFDLWLIPHLGF